MRIWIISGYSGSGKSTLVNMLRGKMSVLSHGQILRELAHENGYGNALDYIENTPTDLFVRTYNDVTIEKIESTIEAQKSFVIDGLVSYGVLSYLRENYRGKAKVIFIDVEESERERRLIERDGFINEKRERSKYVLGIDDVRRSADYIIDGSMEDDTIFNKVLHIIDNNDL